MNIFEYFIVVLFRLLIIVCFIPVFYIFSICVIPFACIYYIFIDSIKYIHENNADDEDDNEDTDENNLNDHNN